MASYQTVFGSLENFEKGGVQVIDDDPKHYCFSNVFEVASKSKPYEKVAVGQNLKYVIEALRAEGNGYVQAIMNRIFEVAAKQESLASAFRKLSSRNLSIIPVVDEQHLVGIVTLQNLMHSMSLLAESRKLRREALDS